MKYLLILGFISILGCNFHSDKEMSEVYKDREKILSVFINVSVFRKRLGDYIYLYSYKNGKRNEYVFSKNQGKYFLVRDTLLFSPDVILSVTSEPDNPDYKLQLNRKLEFYLKEMDSLGISDVSSDFTEQGVILKVYMKSNAMFVYVADSNSITNPEWINYLRSMKKIDDHWYYIKQDQ